MAKVLGCGAEGARFESRYDLITIVCNCNASGALLTNTFTFTFRQKTLNMKSKGKYWMHSYARVIFEPPCLYTSNKTRIEGQLERTNLSSKLGKKGNEGKGRERVVRGQVGRPT